MAVAIYSHNLPTFPKVEHDLDSSAPVPAQANSPYAHLPTSAPASDAQDPIWLTPQGMPAIGAPPEVVQDREITLPLLRAWLGQPDTAGRVCEREKEGAGTLFVKLAADSCDIGYGQSSAEAVQLRPDIRLWRAVKVGQVTWDRHNLARGLAYSVSGNAKQLTIDQLEGKEGSTVNLLIDIPVGPEASQSPLPRVHPFPSHFLAQSSTRRTDSSSVQLTETQTLHLEVDTHHSAGFLPSDVQVLKARLARWQHACRWPFQPDVS